jgi:sialic acid synthase SpsE
MLIADRKIGITEPAYFIADIAANHDGKLSKALDLITAAAESGADAAKFQHFRASKIVSDKGFRQLQSGLSHQTKWVKSVFETYSDASIPWEWTEILADHANKNGIHFFTSPYDLEAVDHIDPFVPAYKIGSGDINWLEIVKYISAKQKPVILASGASTLQEVEVAMNTVMEINDQIAIMQCNTNYTGSRENLEFINLNVLKSFGQKFPKAILGLSDHTLGDVTVLGAITLGARMIEKHFTLRREDEGPDHSFSMTPSSWQTMVNRSRDLEAALGDGLKKVEKNELDTVIIQRRGLRISHKLPAGSVIRREDLVALRPCLDSEFSAANIEKFVGRVTSKDLDFDDELNSECLIN